MIRSIDNLAVNGSDNVERSDGEIVLAIETGISAGSISLLINRQQIDFWIGVGNVSKSEDVLQAIRDILYKNRINIQSIDLLVISGGPGSFTGLRIGAAIAKGLAKAIGCEIEVKPVLEAILVDNMNKSETVIAVPFGKTQVCWKFMGENSADNNRDLPMEKAFIGNKEEFTSNFQELKGVILILHQNLFDEFYGDGCSISKKEKNIINAGSNIAMYIGKEIKKTTKMGFD